MRRSKSKTFVEVQTHYPHFVDLIETLRADNHQHIFLDSIESRLKTMTPEDRETMAIGENNEISRLTSKDDHLSILNTILEMCFEDSSD